MRRFTLCLLVWLAAGVGLAAPALGAEGSFDSDGVRIRYTDEGVPDGVPVILIHGYTASSDLNWRIPGVIKRLADKYRVVTLDHRGHGKSDKPTDTDAYGVKMVADVLGLLDHLQIKRAHFVGYSMGGMITLKAATIAPERMLSALVGGMGWVVAGPAVEVGDDPRARPSPALRACLQAFPLLGITRDELMAIEVPTQVVIGSDDGLLARRVKPLSEVRSDIPIVEIAGANHVTCIFNPAFAEAIRAFLDRQPSPAEPAAEDADR